METVKVLEYYIKYKICLDMIGNSPFESITSMKELNLPRAPVVHGYRMLKNPKDEFEFQGELLDFFCWISFLYIKYLADVARLSVVDFISERLEEHLSDIRNTLRLFTRRPHLVCDLEDEAVFMKFCKIWLRLIKS